jgi:hypothetical protein
VRLFHASEMGGGWLSLIRTYDSQDIDYYPLDCVQASWFAFRNAHDLAFLSS